MLNLESISFSYGDCPILDGVSLSAGPGELIFLLGANGAGKTTLFRCLLGLLDGYTGRVTLDGQDLAAWSPRQRAERIAYIPQAHHPAFAYTVLDVVLMGTNHRLGPFAAPGRKERQLAMEALSKLHMEDAAGRNFAQLSGGEQQLVLLARALAQEAKILILDEPTSALDFGNQVRVLEQIAALSWQGYTILLSCHNPQQAMLYASRVIALDGGRIVADGPPRDAVTPALLRQLYGVPARFLDTDDGVLIAPVRRSMFRWTPDMIRFMVDAEDYNGAAETLAAALRQLIPGDEICDAGCGVGGLSLALTKHFSRVIAADLSADALAALEQRRQGEQPEILHTDILSRRTDMPYASMVFCSFGQPDEILTAARRQCSGTVAVVQKANKRHAFSLDGGQRRLSPGRLVERLDALSIPYSQTEVAVDKGQPFRSLNDAVLFFHIYNRGGDASSVTAETVLPRLEQREDDTFPLYYPSPTTYIITILNAPDIPEMGGTP